MVVHHQKVLGKQSVRPLLLYGKLRNDDVVDSLVMLLVDVVVILVH
jgi:hypothetical protein